MAKPPYLRPLAPHEVVRTCAYDLQSCVDALRQCLTDEGLRPYRVRLVWYRWTADMDQNGFIGFDEDQVDDDTVGAGKPVLVKELDILPTPRVTGMQGVSRQTFSTGETEVGGVSVDQISTSYSEDILMGLADQFRDPERPDALQEGVSFFWEIQEHRPPRASMPNTAGGAEPTVHQALRRRFHPSGAPMLTADSFQWTISLTRADGERTRAGVAVL